MSDPVKNAHSTKEENKARETVESGKQIRERMRDITLAALSSGKLDTNGVKLVLHSVVQGAVQGVSKAGGKTEQALSEALAGVDEALVKAAEASKLAIEEAAGRLHEYSKRDLEQAFSDLRTLESMLLDTIKEVADHSVGEARDILHTMRQHAKNSGTAAGASAAAAIATLEQKLGRTLREAAAEGSDIALSTSSRLAEAASGFLAGIAAALDKKSTSARQIKR
jgi:hypothetical protein